MIAVGAAVGAPARYLTDRAIQSRHETVFPWGTLVVNVVASLVLGILTGASSALAPAAAALLGTGLCGALSTFSTFGYETLHLVRERSGFYAAANVAIAVVAGIGAAAAGWAIGASVI
ncbi:MAG: fluoride efflux transporter FluC [Jatrophihabitantaceae bacterium]